MNGHFTNCTGWKEFHLLAFSTSAGFQLVIFIGILLMYLLTVVGNLIITVLICRVSQLHTPMYYFLCNLSVQDIIYVSATLPKLLAITLTGDTRIVFPGCITQLFLFIFCVGTEFLLLTSMAYDRYVAICVPLHYRIIMNKITCILLVVLSWHIGFLNALTQSVMMSYASFCNSQDINHFYCDLKTMIKLASSDTTNVMIFYFAELVVLGFLPFLLILTSYICIISTIIKIHSSGGRAKAFSSCSSHLTVVILFYGTSLGSYMIPESEHSEEHDKILSLLYTAVVPLLNPLVYTLRNKEVLRSMKNINEKYFGFRSCK